ncbi:MAG: hypothetical protein AB1813_14240 [Verrucomicrobiota bacterium]
MNPANTNEMNTRPSAAPRSVSSIPSTRPRVYRWLRVALVGIGLSLPIPCCAQSDWLDKLDQALAVESANGFFRSDLSALLDFEGYYIDQNPPGLLFPDDDFFFNPRLSLFLDTRVGKRLYSLVQVRVDRGFDPGAKPDGDARFDEYFLRYTPFDEPVINFQVGKFATVIGNWIARHDSWNNSFITTPAPYENVTIITDHAVPVSVENFLARKSSPDKKQTWLPIIWGPSYATGGSVFGLIDKFDYAFELKNASLSSRPYAWDADTIGWEYPTVSGRVGYKPNATWSVGASGSHGAYLLPPAEAALPAGTTLGSFMQTTVGTDVRWAWRHWQVFAEAYASRFEMPFVGDADTLAYYLETKYKLTPRCYVAARWNQQFFDEIRTDTGALEPWDRDLWRVDTAVGYRFDRHLQAKLQYSYSHQKGSLQQGEQLVAAQLTLKF